MRQGGKIIAGLMIWTVSTEVQAHETVQSSSTAEPAPGRTSPAHSSAEVALDRMDCVKDATTRGMELKLCDNGAPPSKLNQQHEGASESKPLATNLNATPNTKDKEIVVNGQLPRGSVIGDIPPERTFNPLDIRAYGANDIDELLQILTPQLSSNRGRENSSPVVLLNGKRVSSFAEVSKIPAEAIERMEVYPEELALKYGYPADQKIVNIVVFKKFTSRVGQLTLVEPTDGGRDVAGLNANYLRIRDNTRFNFDAKYDRSRLLLESERGVLQAPETPALGQFRTLLPQTERLELNSVVSGDLIKGVSSTLNGRFEENKSKSLLGLGDGGPLTRDIDTRLAHLGTSLGGSIDKWLWSFTGNYDRVSADTLTDTNNGLGVRDKARLVNSIVNADLVLSGSVLKLPAGPVSASFRSGVETRSFNSRSILSGAEQNAGLFRNSGTVQINLDVPIASQREESLSWLGNLSANTNVAIEELSAFGTLRTFGYGLYWSPVKEVNIITSATDEEGAPTLDQLGAPLVVTPNVRTFDFTRREVVDITQILGGNSNLHSDHRHVIKLGIDAKPFLKTDFTISIDYTKTRVNEPIAPFPIATSEVEAAFPDRFTRDIDGRLLQIDSRPLNFQQSRQQQVRWGVNLTRPLGSPPQGLQNGNVRFAGSEADLKRMLPPGATIMMAEPGSAAGKAFGSTSSRLILSFYHTWHLEDVILIRKGVPVLDFLNGSAVGNRGGRPRHELEFQAGVFKRGLGARITANWQSRTGVHSLSTVAGNTADDLNFSSYSTVNINLFANPADRLGGTNAPKWLKGSRVSIGVSNLFNSRPEVHNGAGSTPLSFQPAYLDPLGRLVNFSLRKVF